MMHTDVTTKLPTEKLTSREIEVMTWAARGKTYGEISVLLSIGKDTAKDHMEHARSKLKAKNKTHAIAIAMSLGLIKL
jgi:DNA-binding CsgD family transcriptional regulator